MRSLNLIGTARVRRIAEQKNSRTVIWISAIAVLLTALVIGAYYTVGLALTRKETYYNNEFLRTRVVTPGGQDLPITETTKSLNKQLKVLQPVVQKQPIDEILLEITQAVPSGIQLTQIDVNAATKSVHLLGIASSRNDIPVLQKKLTEIQSIDKSSLKSDINERTNVAFEATALLLMPQTK